MIKVKLSLENFYKEIDKDKDVLKDGRILARILYRSEWRPDWDLGYYVSIPLIRLTYLTDSKIVECKFEKDFDLVCEVEYLRTIPFIGRHKEVTFHREKTAKEKVVEYYELIDSIRKKYGVLVQDGEYEFIEENLK